MNFAAHFFLDRHRPEHLFHIGAATPDLLSIYNAQMRIKEAHLTRVNMDSLSNHEKDFIAGLRQHFHADRVFHSSDFFREETADIGDRLKRRFEEGFVPRKFFIAHILLELLLDKVLIEGHPGMLTDYYAHFDEVPTSEIQRVTEIAVGHELPNYAGFLRKFISNQYLYQYTERSHIAFVVTKILERVAIPTHEFTRGEVFLNLMEAYEDRLESNYPGIFEEIREKEEK